MVTLNLPNFAYRIQQKAGTHYIFDVQRKKYVLLTSEEWVRQHFVHYLIRDLQYPKGLIGIERGILYNQLQKRVDILVYGRDGKPWMLVECKNPKVKLAQKLLKQVLMYYHSVQPNYIVVTNGLQHWCAAVDAQQGVVPCALPSFPKGGKQLFTSS